MTVIPSAETRRISFCRLTEVQQIDSVGGWPADDREGNPCAQGTP